ncbi:lysophospholipid acyltransferase family protein [Chitinolyticbacter albus]|uniref:lysophospholipid acyltransferase family protein n=1 Tax=Chitinolyticbacter albus TaxID=2961951 RepID=UPI0021088C15|nr:lysophospholipid acyltransferase family protein [Chitinolyticbacter albus]
MLERVDRYWRVLATGIAFTTFGVGGLLLWLVFLPLLSLCFWLQASQRASIARWAVHACFASFVGLMCWLGILRYEIHGLDRLRRGGLLILANHPTLLDVVFLISLVPNADCVVKGSLARNPFTRGAICATNYICNDSGSGLVEDGIRSLRQGSNLIIFPEGTRTPVDGKMKLQRGAANIAVRGLRDITPVTIRCEPLSLTKGLPWWQVPPRRMHFTLEIRDDIAIQPFLDAAGGEALAARHLTDYLHDYFAKEVASHARA